MKTRVVVKGGDTKLELWIDGETTVEVSSHPQFPVKGQDVQVWAFGDGEIGVKRRTFGEAAWRVVLDHPYRGSSVSERSGGKDAITPVVTGRDTEGEPPVTHRPRESP